MTSLLLRPVLQFLAGALLFGALSAPTLAQDAAPPAQTAAPDAPSVKVARIAALIDGTLDPAVPAASLFDYSLAGSDALRLQAVLKLVGDEDYHAAVRAGERKPDGLNAAQIELALAEASFLRLSANRQRALLTEHAKKHSEYQQSQKAKEAQGSQVERLSQELAALRAFLDGKPTSRDALTANPVTGVGTVRSLTGQAVADLPEPDDDAPAAERIAWLKNEVLAAQQDILRLSPARLAQLRDAAGLQSADAEELALAEAQLNEARTQLNDAEQAALDAASEHERLIAQERARLLQVKQEQARFRTMLAQSAGVPQEISDNALSWRRRTLNAAEGDGEDLDALYNELVAELTQLRKRLRVSLDKSEYPSMKGLRPAPLDTALPVDTPETAALMRQSEAIERTASALRESYAERLWAERTALHDAMSLLNEARLGLLGSVSRGKRARVTGFGSEGVAQVRREISEIVLELRFNVQSWRRTLSELSDSIARPSPGFVGAMLRIFALLLFFAWWRRRGDAILARAQRETSNKRPRTMSLSMQVTALRIWRSIRIPLDWLILVTLLWWLWPEELSIIGSGFVWIVLFWSLSTFTLVRLVNELARGRGRDDPRAALRWRSLKLIAGSLLVIGLMLDLARESVGRGAIYQWVSTLAWLWLPVVAVILARWWRSRIVALAKTEAGESTLLRWVGTDPGGATGSLGRIAVGGVLLVKGLNSIVARRIRDVALVREMLEQRARAVAVRQVAQDKASGRFHRLAPEVTEHFDPHRMPATLRTDNSRPGYAPLPMIAPGSLNLIVGERGLGKSSIVHDLGERAGSQYEIISLQVPGTPPPDYLDTLAKQVGLSGRKKGGERLVFLDDIQRLIVPAIGGLSTLDRLVTLARESGASYRWVFTLSAASWRFLQRARGERILFDNIIQLPHWTAEELRSLIERRTAQAGIEPDFSAMVDDGVFEFGEDVSPEERKKRGYFERLTEYASGNPAIALDYWRRSLFVDGQNGMVTVRTFDTPPLESLSTLPIAALFVLRVILQMDFANKQAIQASTDLSDMLVTDALRRLERIGAVVHHDAGYQISLHWWIEVVRLLARQNLIVREKS